MTLLGGGRASESVWSKILLRLRMVGARRNQPLADYFDTRVAPSRTIGAEENLKIWAKAAANRTVKPSIEKLAGQGIQHVFICKQAGQVVATGRGQTPVGATRDACTQLGI